MEIIIALVMMFAFLALVSLIALPISDFFLKFADAKIEKQMMPKNQNRIDIKI